MLHVWEKVDIHEHTDIILSPIEATLSIHRDRYENRRDLLVIPPEIAGEHL